MGIHTFQRKLGYIFNDSELLTRALTHRSCNINHNERLEFLGDSVLNCAVAAMLYRSFNDIDEGILSRVRASLVRQETLYEQAQRLKLSNILFLGEGEMRSGGAYRPSMLADAMEAVFGAIFIDGGFNAATVVIERIYLPLLDGVDISIYGKDPKTRLQEYLQSQRFPLPTYILIATIGAAHNQMFEVRCDIPEIEFSAIGQGSSRRFAEQRAAAVMLKWLASNPIKANKQNRPL